MTTARSAGPGLATLAALAAGCGSSLAPPCESGSCATQVYWHKTVQSRIDRNVDLLFVVDDTPAIAPYAAALPVGFATIAQALADSPLPPSVHAGFVRAGGCDSSTRGGACGVGAPEQFLRAEWCQTVTNATLPIADAFSCLGDLGTGDCGPAQPLSAAAQALTTPRPGWDGFLRPDAYLVILVVAAQDDASGAPGSPTAIADIVARILALKADPSQVLVSVIGPQSCSTAAVATPRLTDFVAAFGANGVYTSLCDDAFTAAIDRVAQVTNVSIDPPCVTNVRDIDRQAPGLQASCTVQSVSRNPDGSQTTSQLPSCDTGPPPCWRIGPTTCFGQGWIFSVEEPTDWCFEAGINLAVECLACGDPHDPACALPLAQ